MADLSVGVPRNLSDATLTVKDGTGSPKTLLIALDQGTLDFDYKVKTGEVYNRQAFKSVREGRKQMHSVSFSVGFDFLSGDTSGTVPSLFEALSGTGLAATQSWTGVDAANGSKYCTNLTFEIASPGSLGKAETLIIGKFFLESFHPKEGEFATMAQIQGRCVTITSTRH